MNTSPIPFGPIRPLIPTTGSSGGRSFMQVWNGRTRSVAPTPRD